MWYGQKSLRTGRDTHTHKKPKSTHPESASIARNQADFPLASLSFGRKNGRLLASPGSWLEEFEDMLLLRRHSHPDAAQFGAKRLEWVALEMEYFGR